MEEEGGGGKGGMCTILCSAVVLCKIVAPMQTHRCQLVSIIHGTGWLKNNSIIFIIQGSCICLTHIAHRLANTAAEK